MGELLVKSMPHCLIAGLFLFVSYFEPPAKGGVVEAT
jgi:hypothetical protein